MSIVIYCLYSSFCMCMLPNMAWWRGAGTEFMEVSMVDGAPVCASALPESSPRLFPIRGPQIPCSWISSSPTSTDDVMRRDHPRMCWATEFSIRIYLIEWGLVPSAIFRQVNNYTSKALPHVCCFQQLKTIYSIKIYQTSRPYKSQANDSKTKQIPRASGISLCMRAPEKVRSVRFVILKALDWPLEATATIQLQ